MDKKTEQIKKEKNQTNEESEIEYIFKITLIGDSGTGKSCLLLRFGDNAFEENFVSTIGVDFRIKKIKVKEKNIKLQIVSKYILNYKTQWDASGQERFETITVAYYKGSHGIIILYDISNKNSFLHIKHWIDNINKYTNDVFIVGILVGNKCDLGNREVSEEEGKILANTLGLKYIEISAKTGQNVDNLFYNLTEEILKMEQEKININYKPPLKIDDENYFNTNLPNQIKEEKSNNQKLKEKIIELEKQLEIEKAKNNKLEEKLKKFENLDKNIDSKESLMKIILEKDKEINELKIKLSRFPFELKEGEKLMTVNFISADQKVQHYSVICKNTDSFNVLEKKLYEDYKEFYETDNYFTFN